MLKFFVVSFFPLLFTTEVLAQQAAPVEIPITVKLLQMAPMFVIVFLIFYFLVVKPQNQKVKTHQELVKSLKVGDKVLTNSGIYGKVSAIEEGLIALEVATNVKIKFDQEAIAKKI